MDQHLLNIFDETLILIPIFSFKKRIQSETVLVLLILYNIYHLYVQCYHEYI